MMLRLGWLLGMFLLTGWAQAAEPVAVACALTRVEQETLLATARAEIQAIAGEQVQARVSAMGAWPALLQPTVVLQGMTLRSRMAATVMGKACGSEQPVTEMVWFKVQALREAWVYGRNTSQDSRLADASPRREVIDIAALQVTGSELAESLEGQWLRQAVYAGRPVLQKQLRNESLVRRDQNVAIVVRGSGLELRMRGKALQSGALGDSVPVLVSGAESSMPATVAGKGEVHVDVEM